ncbi:MAG TPA: universal stress protein [Thermodesulfovibrionales bacterium]|nr:universal stress protein [Thermodesulfovibrionales bacterium]
MMETGVMEGTMYQTIVVGYDESISSKAALTEASHWVKRHGGKVVLVHAVFFDEEEFGIAPTQLDKRLKLGEKVCYQAKETIASEFGIEALSLLCEGDPPEVIVDIAREKKADLIVMGTYGRKGLNRILMGSATSQVIVKSGVDVLVVKRECSECTGSYRSVLLAYDGSDFSRNALSRACELSKLDEAEITALYVIPRYEEMIGFLKTSSIKDSMMQEAQKIIDGAKKLAAGHDINIKTMIEDGHAADSIIATAARLKNDLIIIGSYGWRGVNKAIMGSTAERVLIGASCPILVVR